MPAQDDDLGRECRPRDRQDDGRLRRDRAVGVELDSDLRASGGIARPEFADPGRRGCTRRMGVIAIGEARRQGGDRGEDLRLVDRARDGRDLVRPVDRERQGRWRCSPRQGGETRQRSLGLGAAIVSDETAAAPELLMNPHTERRQLRARYAGQHDLLDLGDAGESETVCGPATKSRLAVAKASAPSVIQTSSEAGVAAASTEAARPAPPRPTARTARTANSSTCNRGARLAAGRRDCRYPGSFVNDTAFRIGVRGRAAGARRLQPRNRRRALATTSSEAPMSAAMAAQSEA